MLEESPLLAYSSEDESMQSHSLDLVLDGQQKQLTLDDAYLALTPDEHSGGCRNLIVPDPSDPKKVNSRLSAFDADELRSKIEAQATQIQPQICP